MDAFKKFARREVPAFKSLVPDRLRSVTNSVLQQQQLHPEHPDNVEEGFICPECHQRFTGSDALGLHYENAHMQQKTPSSPSVDAVNGHSSSENDHHSVESTSAFTENGATVNGVLNSVENSSDGLTAENDDEQNLNKNSVLENNGHARLHEYNGEILPRETVDVEEEEPVANVPSVLASPAIVEPSPNIKSQLSSSHLEERVPTPFNYNGFGDESFAVSDIDDNSGASAPSANFSSAVDAAKNDSIANGGSDFLFADALTTSNASSPNTYHARSIKDAINGVVDEHRAPAAADTAEQNNLTSNLSNPDDEISESGTPSPNMLSAGEDDQLSSHAHASADEIDETEDDDENSPVSHVNDFYHHDAGEKVAESTKKFSHDSEHESETDAVVDDLRAQLDASEELLQERTELLEALQSQNEQITLRLRALETRNSTLEREVLSLGSDRDAARSDRNRLQKQLSDTENDAKQQNDRISSISVQLSTLTTAQNVLAVQLSQSRQLLDEKSALATQLQELLDRISSEKFELEQNFASTTAERDRLQNELNSARDEIATEQCKFELIRTEREELHAALLEKRREYDELSEQLTLQQQAAEQKLHAVQNTLKSVEAARDLAISRVSALETSAASAAKAHADVKRQLEESQTRVQELHDRNLANTKSFQLQLNDAEHRIRASDQLASERQLELDSLGAEMKAEHTKRYEELSRYEQSIKEAELLRALAEENVGKLKRDLGERLTRLAALERDKTALLDKCLEKDEAVDKLKSEVRELTRKWDDAVTAMQELGRENQALKLEFNRLSSRKWVSDTEAGQCMKCDAAFGVSRRKHHCRNCGQVFCDACSSKRERLPSSKTPVRVCNKCYDELQLTK